MDTKKQYHCNICNLPFKNYCAYYYHKNKLHKIMSSSKPSTSLKRNYEDEVNNLLDRGEEVIQAGGDRKRVIARWKSNAEANFASEQLLEAIVKKENEYKKEYMEARKIVLDKLKLFQHTEGTSTYLSYLMKILKTEDDKYETILSNELLFLDYTRDIIQLGIKKKFN
jgi:hypothetical protein